VPRLAANVSLLFTEVPFLDRFERAAAAGFGAVELQSPYPYAAEEIARRLEQNRLQLVLCNLPTGDWEAGERGIACHPDRIGEFRADVERGMRYAKILGVAQLNCLAGKLPHGIEPALARATFVANLRYAAAEFARAGLKLLIEPINTFDVPDFFLNRTEQAIAILQDVAAENAFVQYDVYHAQRMEGELAGTLTRHRTRIGHIQIADNPGRHEPGSGEINFEFLFRHLDRIGYSGWIGCEYLPIAGTEAGLSWRKRLGVLP
jgi:hydroxypyruvate isomerase